MVVVVVRGRSDVALGSDSCKFSDVEVVMSGGLLTMLTAGIENKKVGIQIETIEDIDELLATNEVTYENLVNLDDIQMGSPTPFSPEQTSNASKSKSKKENLKKKKTLMQRLWVLFMWWLMQLGKVEFKRISLTGFHSCTSRSRYQSVSKQTTRYPCEASHGHRINLLEQ
ncbi:hypothetical protein Tco_0215421 [Tanacetum coccineum]